MKKALRNAKWGFRERITIKRIDFLTCSRTWATFILYAESLDPKFVTKELNLEPSYSFKKGEIHGNPENPMVWRNGHWDISSEDKINSDNLSDHIEWILNKIETKKTKINEIMEEFADSQAYITCFWELEEKDANGGPIFKPELLKRIANLDLELWIDFYS